MKVTMDELDWLAKRFEEHRAHMRAVAYRCSARPLRRLLGARPGRTTCARRRAVWAPGGRPRVVFGFAVTGGKIVEIELVADPAHLSQLDLTVLDD